MSVEVGRRLGPANGDVFGRQVGPQGRDQPAVETGHFAQIVERLEWTLERREGGIMDIEYWTAEDGEAGGRPWDVGAVR